MKQYGLVKTLQTPDGEELKLCGNALTFVLYKSYFGRELLSDIIAFAKKNTSEKVFEALTKFGVKSAEDLNGLDEKQTAELINSTPDFGFDSEFVLNFIASLMATAMYPQKVDITELICAIPPSFITNQAVLSEVLEFLSLFITDSTKNQPTALKKTN
jgi:hypothetical protein